MQQFIRAAGGLAIVILSFFATLFAMDYTDSAKLNNRRRADDAKALMSALDAYYRAKGSYPNMAGGPIDGLKPALVDGGFLKEIPKDPKGTSYSFVSTGAAYGILFAFETEPFLTGKKPGGICVVGVKIKGSGAWGDPPECPL